MIDRTAWTRGGALPESPLPVQMRFRPILQCPAISDGDSEVLAKSYLTMQRICTLTVKYDMSYYVW
jgi:hypothetical protein